MKQRDIGRDKRGEVSKLLKRRLNDASNICTNSNYPTKFWFHWDFCWTMWSSFVFLLRSKEHSFVDRINLAPQLFDWLLAWTCIYLSKVGARVWSALYQFLQILKLIKIVYAFQVSKINCSPLLRNTKAGWINRCCLGPEKSNLLRLKGKNAESSSSIRLHKSKDQFSKIARNPVFQPHANPLKLLYTLLLYTTVYTFKRVW